jgi:hypothetical protein
MKTIDLASGTPGLSALLDLASQDNVILRAEDGRIANPAQLSNSSHSLATIRLHV